MVEDNPREIEEFVNEEGAVVLPSTQAMAIGDNWVHYPPSILLNGRHTHIDPEGADEEETEKLKKQQESQDPYDPRLKSIENDRQVVIGNGNMTQKAWSIKHMGDKNVYIN